MKDFFKMLFASCLGTLLALTVGVFLMVAIVGGIVAAFSSNSSEEVANIEASSILHLKLDDAIAEQTQEDVDFSDFSKFSVSNRIGLYDMVLTIREAKTNDKIKGIYLDLPPATPNGMAALYEIRKAIEDFKTSKKFVYAFARGYSQGDYYLASVADSVFMHREGQLYFTGFASQSTYFKGLLDRLNIQMEIFKAGKYKSAVEPFTNTSASEASKEQTKQLLEGLYAELLGQVSKARNIPVATLRGYADAIQIRSANDALRLKMVDRLVYADEMTTALKKRAGVKEDDDLEFVSPSELFSTLKKVDGKASIALVQLDGEIVDGKGERNQISTERTLKTLQKIRKNEDIKAVVLRINSPGGSAFASEEIWREVSLLAKKMPVITSMGTYAASGGYYIATPSTKIFAEPTTITGSIGVFGILATIDKFMAEKAGITFDRVKTGPYADFGDPTKPFSEMERTVIQAYVDSTYGQFTSRVAVGRKMALSKVLEIGGGRVYTGLAGKELGLVDEVGTLDDALAFARKSAKVAADAKYREYPASESAFEQIFSMFETQMAKMAFDVRTVPIFGAQLGELERMLSQSPVQMKCTVSVSN